MISTNEWSILNRWMNYDEECCEISVTQFVAKDLWKIWWNICHSIDVMHDVLKVCWKFVMHDVLKVCWKFVMHDVLKVCWRIIPQILMNVVKWMLWSECEICSSYIFHNLSEYMEVFWLICYRSSFKNVCHYNCWMKLCHYNCWMKSWMKLCHYNCWMKSCE